MANLTITRTPATWTEFWDNFAELNKVIRTWEGVGLSTFSATNGGDEGWRNYRHGTLGVHGYDLKGFPAVTHSFNIRTKFAVEHSWFFELCRPLDRALLDEGYSVSVNTGEHITHLMHNGKGKISFGVKMEDEEIYLRYLRGDYGKMKLREVKGTYDYDIHP